MSDAHARTERVCGAAFVLALILAASAQAQTPPEQSAVKVVVIPTRSHGGPDLADDAKSLIETPLIKNATIIALEHYKNAVKAAGHPSKELADITTIRAVAKTVGITHAVVVEGSTTTETENGKSVKANTIEVSLIDATSGAVLYTSKRALTGARLTRSVSTPIVAVLTEKLSTVDVASAAAAVPVPEPVPSVVLVAPVPPPPAAAPPVVETPVEVAETPVETEVVKEPAYLPAEPIDVAPEVTDQVNMHPTLALRLGLLAMARDGRISSVDGSAAYDGPLVATNLSVAYFPWAKRSAKAPERGVGVYAEGYLTRTSTDFRAGHTSDDSTVASFEVGGAYRFPLGLSSNAPVITLQLGYAYSTFPLAGVVFPGINYSSPEVGFIVDAPIVSHLALFVGGKFFPWMSAGGNSDRLGRADGIYAVRTEAGLRLQFAPFELIVAGRYQQYNGNFFGISNLGLASELDDIDYTDRYYGAVISAGYSF